MELTHIIIQVVIMLIIIDTWKFNSMYEYKSDNIKYYTLEEFEKEFPFKIGDKVIIIGLTPKILVNIWDYMIY